MSMWRDQRLFRVSQVIYLTSSV
ncbi:hypothetical protein NC652_021302 [Populus alba x Populus x berolinensis]|nr:hypothetical protein NC652_021302 [Populus alba x Populus x berolinensis]